MDIVAKFIEFIKWPIGKVIVFANILCTFLYWVDIDGTQELLNGFFVTSNFLGLKIFQLFRLCMNVNERIAYILLGVIVAWIFIGFFVEFAFNNHWLADKFEPLLYNVTVKRAFALGLALFILVGNTMLLLSYAFVFIFCDDSLFNELSNTQLTFLLSWLPFIFGTIIWGYGVLYSNINTTPGTLSVKSSE